MMAARRQEALLSFLGFQATLVLELSVLFGADLAHLVLDTECVSSG